MKSVLSLPRLNDELATVNLAVKGRLRDKNYYKSPELVRPKVINDMLKILIDKHKSYHKVNPDILSESSKYKFITLPLVGEKEPNENILTLDQAFEKLTPLVLSNLKLKLNEIIPINANCFINSLLDQIR